MRRKAFLKGKKLFKETQPFIPLSVMSGKYFKMALLIHKRTI